MSAGRIYLTAPSHYIVDPETYAKLRAIMTVIYDDRPLAGDRRRDLANRMDAVLHSFIPVHDEPKQE